MKLKGFAHKYGADVNTDLIIPARCLQSDDHAFWKAHCMKDLDTDFVNRVKPGDFIVATTNFGCGSSREQAPIVIKDIGVSCVIASSFARIFFRNAINIGLPILESPEASDATTMGDELAVDLATGEISNLTKGKTFDAKPYPDFMMGIIERGGLIAFTNAQFEARDIIQHNEIRRP
jgi:3-isopropylmalate/(R)-2-methylmalate dehydratase small subunit